MGFIQELLRSVIVFITRYLFIAWRKNRLPTNSTTRSKREEILKVLSQGPVTHRGGVPENTMKAFHESKAKGATSVEVDLQFTKDGHPVLFHDDTVDRTSDGTGTLSKMTLEEVRKLDVGVKFGYPGVRIPTLKETIDTIKELDLFLFLEVKALSKEAIPILLKLFTEDEELYSRIAIISFFPDVIHQISQLDSRIKIGYIFRSTILTRDPFEKHRFQNCCIRRIVGFIESIFFWAIRRIVLTSIHPFISVLLPHKRDVLRKRFDHEQFRKEGTVVLTWTVNDDKEQEHLTDVLRIPYMTDHAPNP